MARILVVDDDPVVRSAVALLLTALGHAVTCAVDVRTALLAVEAAATPYDRVVLDSDLPDGTGAEVAGVLALAQPDARVVLHTGRVPDRTPYGVDAVVGKGPGLEGLLEALAA